MKAYYPTSEDIEKVAGMTNKDCPRRYCWWWKNIAFEWKITPEEGCTFLESPKFSDWIDANVPCCRCNSESSEDHYELRDPQAESDGIDASIFR